MLLKMCQEMIKKEMTETKFVAVMAGETTDISNHLGLQLVIVYMYEVNGNVCERFWGFFNPDGQNAEDISKPCPEKLNVNFSAIKVIAQTFHGAFVLSGSVNGVQARIKEHFSCALYVHCYAHQLNLIKEKLPLIISQGVSLHPIGVFSIFRGLLSVLFGGVVALVTENTFFALVWFYY
jgi:hypothetical protein